MARRSFIVLVMGLLVLGFSAFGIDLVLPAHSQNTSKNTFAKNTFDSRVKDSRVQIAVNNVHRDTVGDGQYHEAGEWVVPPRQDRDAELLAIHVTGELYAQAHIYDRVKRDLTFIKKRDKYTAAYPVYPYYLPDTLQLRPVPRVVEQIKQGRYHHWEQLNRLFRAKSINIFEDSVVLKFNARLNMPLVAQLYESLEGIEHAETADISGLLSDAYYADICLSIEPVSGNFIYIFFHRSSNCLMGSCSTFNYKAFQSSNRIIYDSELPQMERQEREELSLTVLGEWQWSVPSDLANAPPWFVKNSCSGGFWQPLGREFSHYVKNVKLSMSKGLSFEIPH